MPRLMRNTIPSTVAIPRLAQRAKSIKTLSIPTVSVNRIEKKDKVTFGFPALRGYSAIHQTVAQQLAGSTLASIAKSTE